LGLFLFVLEFVHFAAESLRDVWFHWQLLKVGAIFATMIAWFGW
jgi:hypothetical protein